MALPFLRSVADYIHEHYKDNADRLCIVLPSKRGALFLKQHLAQAFGKTMWLPTILSTEDLVSGISGVKVAEELDLMCHLYESYRVCYGTKAENFDSFAKWGQLILQDFNEIDRYLADPAQLYENLKDIKEIENWSLGAEQLTDHQQDYLAFMSSLGAIYKHLRSFLLSQGLAWQGLAYREAAARVANNTYTPQFERLLFCGFNALNAAELAILGHLHRSGAAELLWDADSYYMDDLQQEAGLFLRDNVERFGPARTLAVTNHFKEPKDICLVSVPKQMGQAQVVRQELQRMLREGIPPDRIAVVLANEKLLWPVVQQLPPEVAHVNITMEYPLRYTATYSLIDGLVQLQVSLWVQKRQKKTIYHKDLLALLRQPLFSAWMRARGAQVSTAMLADQMTERNMAFVTPAHLRELFGGDFGIVQPFVEPATSVTAFAAELRSLLQTVIDHFTSRPADSRSSLELEYLQILLTQFNRLSDLLGRYPYFHDLQAFKQLFHQVVGTASAPFIGEPLRGLQLMGVLETRTLDFDHLIVVNVNEGVLPSGKTINSFIPNDLKRAFGLPLYTEKDAVYAYHFYRLLQRASDIVITYDSETDAFGKGEKSRFLTQLELELRTYNPAVRIRERVAAYPDLPVTTNSSLRITKTDDILSAIRRKATSADAFGGLSPSGLTQYKECPLRFYFRYGAGLKETKEVEESAEANTFGSILHLSLETLYADLNGQQVRPEQLKEKLPLVDAVVRAAFLKLFNHTPPAGKSLLQEEVIKVYVRKLLTSDINWTQRLAEKNDLLFLRGLEQELVAPLAIQKGTLQSETVYLRGKIDRMDSTTGQLRIVDYKSSVRDSDRFVFSGFEALFSHKDYNKQLQLFLYTWLVYKSTGHPVQELAPCVIPFKSFSEQPHYILNEAKQRLTLSVALLQEFEDHLAGFVAQILDPSVDFYQTDDADAHKFCAYNTICNFAV